MNAGCFRAVVGERVRASESPASGGRDSTRSVGEAMGLYARSNTSPSILLPPEGGEVQRLRSGRA